ncbi:MAG: hypothetical protein SFU84_07335 [Gemmatimonadales bacterium]|nr:hypothetical protein [Gemmatimonadales bacterium]
MTNPRATIALVVVALAVLASRSIAQARDSAGVRIVESVAPVWTSASQLRLDKAPALVLGRADGPAEQQFGKVSGATRLRDGSVVVADGQSSQLRRFDATGRLLGTMGRPGEGPGDFRWISWITSLGTDSVLVWDCRLQRLTAFTGTGRLLTTVVFERPPMMRDPRDGAAIRVAVDVVGRFADGSFLTSHRLPFGMSQETGMHADTLVIGILRGRGPAQEVGRVLYRDAFVYNFPKVSISGDAPFPRSGALAAGAQRFYVSDGQAFAVREWSPTGSLVGVFRIRRPLTPVTPREIAADKAERLSSEGPRLRTEMERVNNWLVFPATKPAFDALQTDRHGRIWAQVAGDSTRPRQWEVFAPAGAWLGSVTVPGGITVLEIGRDYLLGRAKDQDGVDTVQLFLLRGG